MRRVGRPRVPERQAGEVEPQARYQRGEGGCTICLSGSRLLAGGNRPILLWTQLSGGHAPKQPHGKVESPALLRRSIWQMFGILRRCVQPCLCCCGQTYCPVFILLCLRYKSLIPQPSVTKGAYSWLLLNK